MLTHYGESPYWYTSLIQDYSVWVMNTAVLGTSDPGDNGRWTGLGIGGSLVGPVGYKSADGKTVYWYNENSYAQAWERNQFNSPGVTYYYVAFG